MEQSSKELVLMLEKLMPEAMALHGKIKGVTLARRNDVTEPLKCFYRPAILSTIQGAKQSVLGKQELIYGKNETLLTAVDIPASTRVIKATPELPYLAIMVELDAFMVMDILKEMPIAQNELLVKKSMAVAQTDSHILRAYIRLVELWDKSEDEQKVLAPLILREIYYRLLCGELGGMLRLIYTKNTKSSQIASAVSWIKDNFRENFKIESLAAMVNMSSSSFYRNFNKMISLSPIQYQKHLRLHEAQHLMLMGKDATSTAYLVGYESATQFNREYKRLFGSSPKSDIKAKGLN